MQKNEEKKKPLLRLVMPSKGDMDLVNQEGSEIDFLPIFYGPEAMGPIVQVIDGEVDEKGKVVVRKVVGRYKLKLKQDGRLELKKAQ